jgi:hypothetical protein
MQTSQSHKRVNIQMIKDTDKIKYDQSVWGWVEDLNGDVSIDYTSQELIIIIYACIGLLALKKNIPIYSQQ